ncbi:MAG: SDR family NAD(P)-dependent oxidoreductase [Myxococcales bacterium]|nr:SDR family NAD(P)-dependent oxidoreductase [Myxococcales bacterium]
MKAWDRVLDQTVYFSFDRSGFERHQRRFDPADLAVDLAGRRYAVTGANSGLGLALSRGLAERGATVLMLCRDPARGAAAAQALRAERPRVKVRAVACDLTSPASVDRAAEALGEDPLHGLAHNAGLLPATRSLTADGHELTVAVHLVGPLRLTARLLPALRAAEDARVAWVSSGGMYPRRLDLDALARTAGPYDGVTAYADTKRAQVVLSELLAERLGPEIAVNAMHPGWAATPGVETALPRFYRFTEGRLRTPAQGADTAVWLLAAARLRGVTGGFWFDRAPAATEPLPFTATRPEDRGRLLSLLADWAGVQGAL